MTIEPQLRGQTVVVIGGSAGIGLETARQARAEGADVILAGRDPDRLESAAASSARRAPRRSTRTTRRPSRPSSRGLDGPIDHVMVTAGGPYYAPLAEMDFDEARRALQQHPMLMVGVARHGAPQGPAGRHARVHGRHGRAQPVQGRRSRLGDDRGAPGPDRQPGARGRAGPRQPHRRRVRRHAAVGVAPRRRAARRAATSSARRSRSGASWGRPTSPPWRCTS